MPATQQAKCPSCGFVVLRSGLQFNTFHVLTGGGMAQVLVCPSCGAAVGAVPDLGDLSKNVAALTQGMNVALNEVRDIRRKLGH